jgi:hypothetical protein
MRKSLVLALGVAAVAVATPAMAHDNSWNSRHDWQHDQIDDRHDDSHDQIDEEHARAHDYGLNQWDHRELHRDLEYQHDYDHYQLQRQHQRQHRRDRWRDYYGY